MHLTFEPSIDGFRVIKKDVEQAISREFLLKRHPSPLSNFQHPTSPTSAAERSMARLPHARGLVLTCAWMKRWFFRFSGRLRTSATWTLWNILTDLDGMEKMPRQQKEKGPLLEVKDISYKRYVTLIFQQHISWKISCSVLYWISIFLADLFPLWPFCAARRISFGLGSLWLWFHQFTGDCQTSSASEAGFLVAKFGGRKKNLTLRLWNEVPP